MLAGLYFEVMMSEKLILYHKDKAFSGRVVFASDVERLMSEGWVTSPAHFALQEQVDETPKASKKRKKKPRE